MIRSLLLAIAVAITSGAASAQTYADLIQRADALYDEGRYEESARTYAQAFELEQGSSGDRYNAACSWALAGDAERAFAALDAAVELGYRNVEWLSADEDLQSLHDDPRWRDVVARCRAAEEVYMASINVELYEMFQADQADRRGDIDWSEVTPRDEARRARAQELIDEGALSAPDDFVHAAFIFQHGGDSTSYHMAYELAMKAVALDSTYTRARWIAAAAKDRYLQSIGQPQIYGTQFRMIDGTWTLEPIDTTAVTDEERARWGVPSLADTRARLKRYNSE